jgi:hypothetical protein
VLEFVHKRPDTKKKSGTVSATGYNVHLDHIDYTVLDRSSGRCELNSGLEDYYEDLICGRWRRVVDERYPNDEEAKDNIVQEARNRVGKGAYHALRDNCEHFVTELMLGKGLSHQTDCKTQ